jgi:hypothetical protein
MATKKKKVATKKSPVRKSKTQAKASKPTARSTKRKPKPRAPEAPKGSDERVWRYVFRATGNAALATEISAANESVRKTAERVYGAVVGRVHVGTEQVRGKHVARPPQLLVKRSGETIEQMKARIAKTFPRPRFEKLEFEIWT